MLRHKHAKTGEHFILIGVGVGIWFGERVEAKKKK